jgi:hypothetical protein
MQSIQDAARLALQVQDACNLSGVVRSFHEVLTETLWPEARRLNMGTDWVNNHPISRAYADKIASLAGTQLDELAAGRAFDACYELAAGVSVEVAA